MSIFSPVHPHSGTIPTRRTLRKVLLLLLLFTLISRVDAQQPKPSQHPRPRNRARRVRPLDPLTEQEKQIAERTATSDPRVKELLGAGRQDVISVDFLAIKPEDPSLTDESHGRPIQIGRHADVLFYRYEGDFGVRAVVDLERKSVTQVQKLPGEQVPLSSAQVHEAQNLVYQDRASITSLGQDVKNLQSGGMRYFSTETSDPCYGHRCLYLLFRRGDIWLTRQALVDLTARTVRIIEGRQQ